jgi:hypothetical protein
MAESRAVLGGGSDVAGGLDLTDTEIPSARCCALSSSRSTASCHLLHYYLLAQALDPLGRPLVNAASAKYRTVAGRPK